MSIITPVPWGHENLTIMRSPHAVLGRLPRRIKIKTVIEVNVKVECLILSFRPRLNERSSIFQEQYLSMSPLC